LKELTEFLDQRFWNATAGDWIAFAGLLVLAIILRRPIAGTVSWLVSRLSSKEARPRYKKLFRTLVARPLRNLITLLLFFYAFDFIARPLSRVRVLRFRRKSGYENIQATDLVDTLLNFVGIITITLLLTGIVEFIYNRQLELARKRGERTRIQLLPLIKDVAKMILWTIAIFWILGSVFQVNIPALITGLGIGGIAIALAAKESLENLLASFTILIEKPFIVDDSVRMDNIEGKVIRIGFRSTRLRSSDGTLLIVPNRKLIDSNLLNMSERDLRKVTLTIPVGRRISPHSLDQIMVELRKVVAATEPVTDVSAVMLESFGDSQLQIQIVYHLPQELPEASIAAMKSKVNVVAYKVVAGRTDLGKESA
jgi:MscS family membrane protein